MTSRGDIRRDDAVICEIAGDCKGDGLCVGTERRRAMPWKSGRRRRRRRPLGWRRQSPWGRGPQPPNLEEMLRRSQDRLRRLLPGGFGGGPRHRLVVARDRRLLWLRQRLLPRRSPTSRASSCASAPINRTTTPGLHYHLPSPIETVRCTPEGDARQSRRGRLPRRRARRPRAPSCRKNR